MKVPLKIFENKIYKFVVIAVKKIPLPLIIIAIMLPLRLINLGYSEYICDESVALTWLKVNKSFYPLNFLLSQHKGPLQYLLGGLIFLFTKDVFNEFIFRLPFALANCASIVVFYLFIKNITKNKWVALTSAFLFGINGLLVAFGRIMQYQSLNLLFSLLSIYFYSNLSSTSEKNNVDSEKKILRYSVLGTVFFCLSILAHWDAVFVLPYIALVIFKDVLFKKPYLGSFKKKFVFFNLLVILAMAVLYLVPYLINYRNSIENQIYFQKRVNPSPISLSKFVSRIQFIIFRIKLYNPILFLETHLFLLILSFFLIKKTWFYIIWFLFEIFVFTVIFINPGTHIYNIFIPLLIGFSLSLNQVFNFIKNRKGYVKHTLNVLISLLIIPCFSFLYFQSYTLFVDHNPEYPWKSKMIANFKVGNFSSKEREKYLSNHKIGFPLRREWKKIEEFLSEYEKKNGIVVGTTKIQTNENICPVSFYTGREISATGTRFIVPIRYPLSLVNDYKRFSGERDKDNIGLIKTDFGDTTAQIYFTK